MYFNSKGQYFDAQIIFPFTDYDNSHSDTLFGARKYNFNDGITYFDDEIQHLDGEIRLSNAETLISSTRSFIAVPKDNILTSKSYVSFTKYDNPHSNTLFDARKYDSDDEIM